ncbi:MAG: Ribonuclease D [Elusimicrobia bacterium]|nr:Ribonuclease D [Elusimicrobiota bacterium]
MKITVGLIWKWILWFFRPAVRGGRNPSWPTNEQMALLAPFEGLREEDIVVISTKEGAHRAYQEIVQEKVVGFDTESKPTFLKGEKSTGPHVAQFSTLKRAYIFMLHEAECRKVVGRLMESTQLKKVGFGLSNDVKSIRSKLKVQPQEILDLETLFVSKGHGRGVGVKVAVALVFKRRFRKSRKASTSNWAAHHLTDLQIHYAANDAFAAIKVFHALKTKSH